ncbi:MAG: IS110 family RNA-guided transposase [Chitinophagaceae bacterium]
MKKIKHVVGIDVAQLELVVSLGVMFEDLNHQIGKAKTFTNNSKGFNALMAWVKKNVDDEANLRFVMEATGVYHEKLAYFLDDRKYSISVVLPNKISNYFRTLEVKTINDQTAAMAITRFGLERKLDNWVRPRPVYRTLRQLTRERNQIIDQRTMSMNHLHAEQSEADPSADSIERIKDRIRFLKQQEKEVIADIKAVIKRDEQLKEDMTVMTSVVGIADLTAATVLGELNGYELIRNKRQVASYAGYDIIEKKSGTSVRGKTKISKRGNKQLRKAMYMPALTAIRHDPRCKEIYARLISRHGIKMKAVTAIQRRLLEMMYTVFKTRQPYDKNYLSKVSQSKEQLEETIERS